MAGEEEQIESLKKWWSEYGKAIVTGVLVGAVSVGGWSVWQNHRNDRIERASVEYHEMIEDSAEGESDKVLARAETFFDDYPNSPYTSLASLLAARAAVHSDDTEQAKTHLQRAIEHSDDTKLPEVNTIARIQMARLQIDADDFPGALSTLDRIDSDPDSEPFRNLVIELKGDAQRLSGDIEAARRLYRSLLDEKEAEDADDDPLQREIDRRLNAKIDDLGRIAESLSSDDMVDSSSDSDDSRSSGDKTPAEGAPDEDASGDDDSASSVDG
ncbi:YfgM family protein [Thioalkalivibrio sp. HK1]|uniref:YfgM family protein n=1 Tax=Thioalkalivibrio sp. HK1 TaxID=1469245 RepID=UPI000472CC8A|nr:tetratricopeptide repeat protein [Thioalkalivibrio sp. HK1]